MNWITNMWDRLCNWIIGSDQGETVDISEPPQFDPEKDPAIIIKPNKKKKTPGSAKQRRKIKRRKIKRQSQKLNRIKK